MRSLITLGVVSLFGIAGMVACGDDDGDGPSNNGGSGGASGGNGGASGGVGGASGGNGGASAGNGGGGAGGTAALPPVPTATCEGCVQLTVSNNSATLVAGAVQNQAGYIFVAAPAADPWDLSDVQSITWRLAAVTPNAGYFVQPFLQTTPPEDPGTYFGVFPPAVALDPAEFPANEFVDVIIDVAAIGVVPVADAGADAGDAGDASVPVEVVDNILDAGPDAGDAGVTLTGFDKRFTRFVGLNVGAQTTAPLGWVSIAVDSVTVQGETTFTDKTFTAGAEGLQLNQYQVPTGTLAPVAR